MVVLVVARAHAPLTGIMIKEPLTVSDATPVRALDEFFAQHELYGVPVVTDRERLVGVVHRAAVKAAMAEQASSDYRRAQGIVAEELRSMPLLLRSRRRLSWLSLNIVLNLGAAAVIAVFQDTLAQVIALAVFLPIISDMSGCSGNQAVAVSMRELTLGLVTAKEVRRVWAKEVFVGVLNGVVLGLLVAGAGLLYSGNAWFGLVIGGALALNTVVAVSIGGTVPLLLRRIGMDPALASGPILTTVTDVCGFLFVLGFASLLLARLT
jgi:magnesium transporter